MNSKKGMMPLNKYHINLTFKAKQDLIDIGDYITYTLCQPEISKNLMKGLRKSISQLQSFPYKFPLVQDNILHNKGIRCLPYKNYYIFYKILEATHTIIVLRVGYKHRNWGDILH